jgi:hypothetical protein
MPIPQTTVYHFTCTARLPWIIDTNELRPYRNQIGGLPGLDLLWATTSSQIDLAASGLEAYREQVAALVRLTLSAEDFESGPTITARLSQSTIDHVHRLEADAGARGQADLELWCARLGPLPVSRIICADARTLTGSWKAIQLPCLQHPSNPALRGIILGEKVYCSHRLQETSCIAEVVSLAEWSRDDCLRRRRSTGKPTFETFSEEQWQALRSVRKDWPDGVDWVGFRWNLEGQGQLYWSQHEGRKKFGKPSVMRKRLKAVEGQLRKLQAGLKSLPDHVTHGAPDLAPVQQWVQDWLFIYEHLETGDKFGFAGRSDYYRDMLCEWLLIEWVNTLGGDLSFSRDQFEIPYGPLIDFLSIILTAILGRAPGPSGIAKMIDQCRKADD